ncbi:MAG: ATP phosphoribosyltransferase regulatory subunit [Rhodobacteraceae bacterium]|nr:ATP phosphoribosyltransferase regulatory subunit [Paracoccaceae bacterium]
MIETADPAREAEQARIMRAFADAGAQAVDMPVLQPAETLLDLYGEDIRARAYVTRDPLAGELMLRPDFTVPVVEMHIASGAEAARYGYCGKVFRTQEMGDERPSEYVQAGFEIFDGSDTVGADAEVFALFSNLLEPLNLRAATGDIGVLLAAVRGLSTIERRKAALIRHIWRPRRFRALLDRYGGRSPVPPTRAALIERARKGDAMAGAGTMIGLRSKAEVAARIEALVEDADAAPLSGVEVDLLDDIVDLRDKAPVALERLRDIAVDLPSIADAVDRVEARLEALARRGLDVERLDFEGSYGRTTMEYYDGFVFGFYAEARPDLPPVATGGRYDALTRALGGTGAVPAVGGVVRPSLVVELGR